MAFLTGLQTGDDSDAALGDVAGTEFRRAQSFQIASSAHITSIEFFMRDGATPPSDDVNIRIETSSGGLPSGVLVDPNATGIISAAGIGASNDWEVCAFSSLFTLSGGTTYFIVASLPAQANDVNFIMRYDTNNGYSSGAFFSDSGGGWAEVAGSDLLFRVNGTEAVVARVIGYFDV